MPAFLWNLSPLEFVLIGVVAVLVFGKRLPSVASQTYDQIRRFRSGLDQFRRETGIDHEMRAIERTMHDIEREVAAETPPIASRAKSLPPPPPPPRPEKAPETDPPPPEPAAES